MSTNIHRKLIRLDFRPAGGRCVASAPGGPKTPKEASKTPKMAPRRPRWPQDSQTGPEDAPRQPQEASQESPKRPKSTHSLWKTYMFSMYDFSVLRRSKTAQDAPQTAPRRPKRPPRGPQDGPRGPQDGPRGAQDGPRERQNGARKSPRTPIDAPTRSQPPKKPKTGPKRRQNSPQEVSKRLPTSTLQASWGPWISTATVRESI